ncbi:hypothetical protein PoB_002340300 [Plakobranchus ocellatus]|uniref:Uncharacterized protein n=1 Tax=Plakobranchus ocellatus TaxID=259542 RepID=A0AAV3ZQR6_9GAST|nr:hypothetical protein PoB_002340300 [Plakobranchus ocellatus]
MPYSRNCPARSHSTQGGGSCPSLELTLRDPTVHQEEDHALFSNLLCPIPQYTRKRIMPFSRTYSAGSHSTPGGGSCPILEFTLPDPAVHKEEDHALFSNLLCGTPQYTRRRIMPYSRTCSARSRST